MTPEEHLAKLRLVRLSLPDKDPAPTSPDELLQRYGIVKKDAQYYREWGIRVSALASFFASRRDREVTRTGRDSQANQTRLLLHKGYSTYGRGDWLERRSYLGRNADRADRHLRLVAHGDRR